MCCVIDRTLHSVYAEPELGHSEVHSSRYRKCFGFWSTSLEPLLREPLLVHVCPTCEFGNIEERKHAFLSLTKIEILYIVLASEKGLRRHKEDTEQAF